MVLLEFSEIELCLITMCRYYNACQLKDEIDVLIETLSYAFDATVLLSDTAQQVLVQSDSRVRTECFQSVNGQSNFSLPLTLFVNL